ncbi:hypothetical protein RD110_16415 [Rhodoferax koreense]|uniref:HPr-rel-A system PqqD family protein n=2 Tax=Rhodoferax koreensis TaxID=1842727 RepID=A0A1P8JXU6_9BURK|nr:hypothetical protein RD110_16415 [Rhodoferax koreense]
MSLWSRAGSGEHVYREWPDEDHAVVYDAASGSTHLVELLGMEVLQLLESSPRTPAEIAEVLAARFDEQDGPAIVEYIKTTLLQLQDAGLVVSKSL